MKIMTKRFFVVAYKLQVGTRTIYR